MNIRHWWLGILLLAISTLVGCAQSTPQGPESVTVGYIPIMIEAPLYVALEKGYFREQNLEVKLEPLAGGADMLLLTASGKFDIGTGGLGAAAFNAANGGIKVRIIAPLHAERPPMVTPLMVSKKAYDSGQVRKVQDLKGKPVAINARGAATEYWLDAALRKGGLTIKDVQLQTVPFNNAAAALENGALTGAMIGEPFATLAERQGIAVRIADDFLTDFQPTFVYLNPDFAVKRKAVAERFTIAYVKASRDLQGSALKSDAIAQILEKYTKVPADVIKAAASPIFHPDGKVNTDNLAELQRFFLAQGLLDFKTPLDVTSLIDRSFADKAVKALGPYKPR